ncbi:MAG: hypothetical protein UX69_C0011G0001, partial [candidate division WWE3 bacterium GW2011_GWA2_46_9]
MAAKTLHIRPVNVKEVAFLILKGNITSTVLVA